MKRTDSSCDTLVALGPYTRDGRTLFAKNSDRPPTECQPLSQARKWVRKANEAAAAGATVVGLLPNRSATGWYRDFVVPNAHIIQLHGRAKFIPNHRPVQNSSAPFASIIVIWPKSAASRLLHILTPADVGVMSLPVAA